MKLDSARLMEGTVVRGPPATGKGNWVGAPFAYRDSPSGKFYLTYRIRRPRGVDPEVDRGGESRIAVSSDGVSFEDVWSVRKSAYGTTSIEKSAIYRNPSGRWNYFTSFVNADDGRWCVSMLSADSPERLDPAQSIVLFDAAELGLEGVKDPWIYREGDVYHMFLSVALPTESTSGSSHSTNDIYNTGDCVSATALATSSDLETWDWQGVVLQPNGGWDSYCRRLNTVISINGRYIGFYDGIPNHLQNYEEKTGIAVSKDLRDWQVESHHGPAFESHHGTNALRYMSACPAGDSLLLYYEVATEDGSHDLRVISLDPGFLLHQLLVDLDV